MITTEKREEWLRHLESWRESGLSANKYCIENGINKSSFRYWIDRDNKKPTKKKSFIEVKIPQTLPVNGNNKFSLKYESYEIMIPSAFDKTDLYKILDVLKMRIS